MDWQFNEVSDEIPLEQFEIHNHKGFRDYLSALTIIQPDRFMKYHLDKVGFEVQFEDVDMDELHRENREPIKEMNEELKNAEKDFKLTIKNASLDKLNSEDILPGAEIRKIENKGDLEKYEGSAYYRVLEALQSTGFKFNIDYNLSLIHI